MAIEVVKSKVQSTREESEGNVVWALNVALNIVSNLNEQSEDDDQAFTRLDAISIASMLLSEINNKQ